MNLASLHQSAPRRLRVLTWHVHGTYLHYLSHAPHDFCIVTRPGHPPGYAGRVGALPWRDNVHEIAESALATQTFDCVMYQSRHHFEVDRRDVLNPALHALPSLYLELDPPGQHPTDTRHPAADTATHIVHVTAFNALMWDNGRAKVSVIEHGVPEDPNVSWSGDVREGVVVINHLRERGRRVGCDIYEQMRRQVPLALVGMDSESLGGIGELSPADLPAFMARRRFFFNPIRYTSLSLALVEAMSIGLPVVALATNDLPGIVRNGVNGFTDARPERLVNVMQTLLADATLARRWGQAARETARERFGIDRFAADWNRVLLETVTGR